MRAADRLLLGFLQQERFLFIVDLLFVRRVLFRSHVQQLCFLLGHGQRFEVWPGQGMVLFNRLTFPISKTSLAMQISENKCRIEYEPQRLFF